MYSFLPFSPLLPHLFKILKDTAMNRLFDVVLLVTEAFLSFLSLSLIAFSWFVMFLMLFLETRFLSVQQP